MENQRNSRKDLTGVVTSKMGDKSIKVTYSYRIPHPRYRKVINRKTVVHVHDEANDARLGDRVEIMETRPVSRLKRWRLVRIIERAPILGSKTLMEFEAETEEEPIIEAKPAAEEASEAEAPEAEAAEAEEETKS